MKIVLINIPFVLDAFSCEGCCQRSFHLDNEHNCIKTLGLTIQEAKVCHAFEFPGATFFKFTIYSCISLIKLTELLHVSH
jgi:hypothetical protein